MIFSSVERKIFYIPHCVGNSTKFSEKNIFYNIYNPMIFGIYI